MSEGMAPAPDLQGLCRLACSLFAVGAVSLRLEDGRAWFAPGDEDLERGEEIAAVAIDGGAGRLVLLGAAARVLSPAERARLDDLGQLAGQMLALARRARAAEDREAEFRLLAESSTDTIVRGDLSGTRLYISPSVMTLLGLPPEELIGRKAVDITHPQDAPAFAALLARLLRGEIDVGVAELRQRHRDGEWIWMEASIRLTRDRTSGAPDGYVASVRDIRRRKQTEAQLKHLAFHDALTGASNRILLERRLEAIITGRGTPGRRHALLCSDLDHFKPVNDRFGHLAGDMVLREVVARFQAVAGPDALIARLGGDEFALLLSLPADGPDEADIAQRLIDEVAMPFRHGGAEILIGLSIGIAAVTPGAADAESLIAAADRALYEAKAGGRNAWRRAP